MEVVPPASIIGRDVLCRVASAVLSKIFSNDLFFFGLGSFRRTFSWERYLSVEKELSRDFVGLSPFWVSTFDVLVFLSSSVAPVTPEI
jgi:hypothetical protein